MMMERCFKFSFSAWPGVICAAVLACFVGSSAAAQPQDPKALVRAAVQTELQADRDDHTAFMYLDHDVTPDHDTLFFTVETPQGNLKRKMEDHGRPLNQQQREADNQRINALLHDPASMAKRRANETNDDNQAEQMLKLLPRAYTWTIAGEQGDLIALNFRPDPNFSAGNLEARVLSAMAGQMVVTRDTHRIRSINGKLLSDVTFAWGLLGRLHQGGSFEVQRREVAPGHWQMTQNHTHIEGKALFFKTIGTEEDEVRTEFKVSPAKNIQQAWDIMQHQTP